MADRDSFRGGMRPGYDQAVQFLQDCRAEDAVEQIGYAVVRDVRRVLRNHTEVWHQHYGVLTHLLELTCAEQDTFVLQRLPDAPSKCCEVLRRTLLTLTIDIQFRKEPPLPDARHALFRLWLMNVAEYELLARLEITSQSGQERRTDCMVETMERVRALLNQAFTRLSEECNAGEKDKRLRWGKPAPAEPDNTRPGIQGLPAPLRQSGKGRKRG